MGKIKVKDLGRKLNMTEEALIKKLKSMGIEAMSDTLIDESVVSRIATATSPHIIRRKVKVVTTDEEGNKVERITTNAGGTIQKSVVREKREEKPSYSKEGLGVVRSNYSRNNRNNMQNIVVTQNGKKMEPAKAEIKEDIPSKVEPDVVKEEQTTPKTNNNNVASQVEKNTYNRENSQRPYNNNNRENRPYNNNYNNNGPRRDYRENRNSTNNTNNNGNQRQYNNNNRENRPYNNNNNYNNNGPRRDFRQNGSSTGFNRNNTGYNNNRPGYQNRTDNNNSGYKVNKFIKDTTVSDTIQKETRDYSTTLIDKKKYNTERTAEVKREKKNVNEIREQSTRMDFNKLRGMQVSEEGLMELYDRGETRKGGVKRKKQKVEMNTTKIIPLTEVQLPETMTVKELAESIKKQGSEVIKKLFSMGILATVNQEIDFDTAFLIVNEFGINATKQVVVTEEDVLFDDTEDDEKDLKPRPPIVTIMGHVDHGKTSLLDKIRETNVVSGESGGITQHIGAYKVKINDREITFLDTPGHEAFTEMRARGAQITDIVIIVVAADDGIKPQTIEAINHAKAANVPIIVAINKIDREGANVERVKQELLDVELVPEEWGGDTVCVPISAKTGEGISNLLEMVLLVADVKELKANPNKQAKGTVIEAKLDKTKGALATVLVQRGTLNVGDTIVLGDIVGRVRLMKNDKGESVKKAGPSTPVEILGLGTVPETGDTFYEVKDEKTAHKLIDKRKAKHRVDLIKEGATVTLDDLFNKMKDGEMKNLDIILRADVQGSAEALKDSLQRLSNEEVRVRVIASNTGEITESDVTLAKVSNAIIIGFNVKPDRDAAKQAEKAKVQIKLYNVIYDAINDVEAAMNGMLKPTYKEVVYGTAEVRHLFKVSSIGTIAGSYVKSGKIVRNAMVRLHRNDELICEAKIESLKREKDDAKEVAEGYECGIKLEKFNDIKEGDIFECYDMVEEARA